MPADRLRVLRRDRYACQHRDPAGFKCNASASRVSSGKAACLLHESQAGR